MKQWQRVALAIPVGLLMGWGGYVLLLNKPDAPTRIAATARPSGAAATTAPVVMPEPVLAAASIAPAVRAQVPKTSTTAPAVAAIASNSHEIGAHDDLKAQLLAAYHAAQSTRGNSIKATTQPVVLPADVPSAQSPAELPVTMEDVEALGRTLAPLIEAKFKRTPIDVGQERVSVSMESARLVFADGSPYPVGGEIIFRCAQSVRVPDKYASDSLDRYAIRLARERGGKWRMVSGTSRCESHTVTPKTAALESRVGRVITLSPNWLHEELAEVNR